MSNKSGVASQVISLPRAAARCRASARRSPPTCSPAPATSRCRSPCRRAATACSPTLSLIYSTGNGNGPFGLGWASEPARGDPQDRREGVPRYRDDSTRPASGHLPPLRRGGPGAGGRRCRRVSRYRPRTEGLFARIERVRRRATISGRSRSRDGLVSRYGTPGRRGTIRPCVADPGRARRRVFGWKLTETTDPFGNRIEYEYRRDRRTGGPARWDQLYLRAGPLRRPRRRPASWSR